MTVALPNVLHRSGELVRPALEAALDRLHPRLRVVAAYHRGWVEPDGTPHPGDGGGKALRPTLTLLAAEAVGVPAERALPAAVAVELIHDFSLLHDDVMDGDRTRRHRPTAWTVFGVGPAILAGDGLLALASEVILEAERPAARRASSLLSRTVNRLVSGQAVDVDFESRLAVTFADYTAMAAGKTAALLACSCALGAALGDVSDENVATLLEAGEHLGLAFQLVDDLLGIWGAPDVTGKPVLADLRVRKKSAPVVAALAAVPPDDRRLDPLRRHLAGAGTTAEAELAELATLIEAVGAREAVEAAADRELALAEAAFERLTLAPEPAEQLLALARYVTTRDR